MATAQDDLRVSRHLLVAVRLHADADYVLARRADLTPSEFSRVINGVDRIRPDDERVLRIARAVGISPERAFARSRGRT